MRLVDRVLRQHIITRRALAVLLVIMALVLMRFALIAPAHALMLSQGRWRTQAGQDLADAKGQASAEQTVRKQLSALPGAPVWNRFYPSGGADNPDAALRADVTGVMASAGTTVQSLAPLPTQEEGAISRHGLRLSASMTVDQLQRVVTDLRGQARYLRVERLTISAPIAQTPHTNPPVLVKMVVYGYSNTHRGGPG